jgi:hypothetical protein
MENIFEKELNVVLTRKNVYDILKSLTIAIEHYQNMMEDESDEFKLHMEKQIQDFKSAGKKIKSIIDEEKSKIVEERKKLSEK